MLVRPVPCVLEEFVACQVVLLDALLSETPHYLCLGGNRRMVGAGHPASVLALHACPAHKDVLYGVVEHVSHVEHTGHVRWRNNYGVWFSTIGFAAE